MDGLTQDGLPDAQGARSDWTRGRDGTVGGEANALCRTDPMGDGGGDRIAWLSHTIEVEIIPRLMLAHQDVLDEAARTGGGPVPRLGPEAVAEFTGIVLNGQIAESITYIDRLRGAGLGMAAVHLELLAPVARRLGSLWEEDLIDFTEVTVGLWRLQQVLREFSPAFRSEGARQPNGRRALFGAFPGEQHTLGLLIVTEFFRSAGWEVWDEPSASSDALEHAASREWFDIAGLSAGCESRLDTMAPAILAIRRASANPSISVIVGGPLFIRYPRLAQSVGADAMASDAQHAVLRAEELVARQGSHG